MFRLHIRYYVCVSAFLSSCLAQRQGRYGMLNKKITNVEKNLGKEINDLVSEVTNMYSKIEELDILLTGVINDTALVADDETESTTSLLHQLAALQEQFNQHQSSNDAAMASLRRAFRAEKAARKRLQGHKGRKWPEDDNSYITMIASMTVEVSNLNTSLSKLESGLRNHHTSSSLQGGQFDELTGAVYNQTRRLLQLENGTKLLAEQGLNAVDSISLLSTLSARLNETVNDLLTTVHGPHSCCSPNYDAGLSPDVAKKLQDQSSEIQLLKTALQTETDSRTSLLHQHAALQQKFNEHQSSNEATITGLSRAITKLESELRNHSSLQGGQLDELTTAVDGQSERLLQLEDSTQLLSEQGFKAADSISMLSTQSARLNESVNDLLTTVYGPHSCCSPNTEETQSQNPLSEVTNNDTHTQRPLPDAGGIASGQCESDEVQCPSGQCVPNAFRCDGDTDCPDGFDELHCIGSPCGAHELRCPDGQCVLKVFRCDRDNDCSDGFDERDCGDFQTRETCAPGEFRCFSGENCIPLAFQCDREDDCPDGSDENGCF